MGCRLAAYPLHVADGPYADLTTVANLTALATIFILRAQFGRTGDAGGPDPRGSMGAGQGRLGTRGLLLVALAGSCGLSAPNLAASQSEFDCLALNVYHEARGEARAGQLAVAAVTLNRVRDAEFPDSVCGVVWQRGQFSWTRDGKPDRPYEKDAWEQAKRVALAAWWGQSNVGVATYFHAVSVRPFWARERRKIARVGRHVFYE